MTQPRAASTRARRSRRRRAAVEAESRRRIEENQELERIKIVEAKARRSEAGTLRKAALESRKKAQLLARIKALEVARQKEFLEAKRREDDTAKKRIGEKLRYDAIILARKQAQERVEAKRKSKREAANRRRDRDLGGHSTYKQTSEFEKINKQKKNKTERQWQFVNETI